jgi:hypothetical protein
MKEGDKVIFTTIHPEINIRLANSSTSFNDMVCMILQRQ